MDRSIVSPRRMGGVPCIASTTTPPRTSAEPSTTGPDRVAGTDRVDHDSGDELSRDGETQRRSDSDSLRSMSQAGANDPTTETARYPPPLPCLSSNFRPPTPTGSPQRVPATPPNFRRSPMKLGGCTGWRSGRFMDHIPVCVGHCGAERRSRAPVDRLKGIYRSVSNVPASSSHATRTELVAVRAIALAVDPRRSRRRPVRPRVPSATRSGETSPR